MSLIGFTDSSEYRTNIITHRQNHQFWPEKWKFFEILTYVSHLVNGESEREVATGKKYLLP
jgi:hypothetical protein